MKTINIKFFGKNSLATLLYWISWVCFISYAGLNFDAIFLISGYFTSTDLATTILTTTAVLTLFYLLILIFKDFKSDKMFTSKIVKDLNTFAIVCLCMPLVSSFCNLIVLEKMFLKRSIEDLYPFIILAIFSLFLAAIFRKGFQIQQENDLTI